MEREVVAESRLDSVTVYASGALCRRRVVVPVPPEGPGRIRVGGLPLALDAGSLRARTLSPGPRVTDVRREVRAQPREPASLAALQRDVDAAEEAYDEARARRDRLAGRADATAALRAVPPTQRRGDPPRPAPVEAFLALADFVDTRLSALHARLLSAEDEVSRAEHAWDVARHRLAEASRALPTRTTLTSVEVVVTLAGSTPAELELELELEYVVPGTTWFPSYQLTLSRGAGTAAGGGLAMRANIAQATGEDWTGVRLSLSTADLHRRTSLPELRSMRLGRRQDEAAPGPLWREPPTGTGELFGGYDDAGRGPTGTPAPPVARTRSAFGAVAAGAGAGRSVAEMATAGATAGSASTVSGEGHEDLLMRSLDRRAGPRAVGPRPAAPYGGPPAPAALGAAPRGPGAASRGIPAPPPPGAPAPQAIAFAAAPPLPPSPPQPDPALQDYAGLVLAGPDAAPAARGRLAPDVADGHGAAESERVRGARAVAEQSAPPHAVPVGFWPGSFAYRFDAAAPVDVPADGRWHSVPVDDFPVGLTAWHLCVPALDPAVYAAVELANTSRHALLAGPVEILVDGEYTATVPMPVLAPGQSRRIGIGVEEGVRVARRVRTAESTSTGLRGGSTVVAQSVEIEVANRLGHAVSLELLERVPVSDDKDVRIEDAPADPPWTVVASEDDPKLRRGLRRWRVVVEAGGSLTLTAGHQLRFPVGKAVVGGNRRDA
ncbi:hypothetical protein ABH931_001245 [Streptacidiphilus sp. MAP12-33]|uniref:DUF4139 domain-containing protein n=1 Tax=Streptacidiphilus sp. MAP12-33 TaxID=3156266 RepID=UPI003519ABDE